VARGKYSEAQYAYVRAGIEAKKIARDIFNEWPDSLSPKPSFNQLDHLVRHIKHGGVYVPPVPAKVREKVVVEVEAPGEPDIAKVSRDTQKQMQQEFDAKLLKQLKREKALDDRILEAMIEVAPTIPKVVLPKPKLNVGIATHSEQTAVLLLSDLHIGARVDPEEVGGLGEYSYAVFRERMNLLRESVGSIVAHHRMSHPVKHLVVAILGDLIENVTIFASQTEQVDLDLMAQVLAAIGDLIALLLGLLNDFETISVVSVTGNHGRIGRKGEHKRHLNWDYLISKVLEERFRDNPRITFTVPKAPFAIVDIDGYNWLFRHGDNIKSWAGIPWYGLERSTGKWIALQAREGRVLHYAASGHLHQQASIPYAGVEILVNGSVVGTTSFSVEQIEAVARPMQWFGFVHPKYGVAGRYYVVLDKPRSL
jgi:hypothetical protein